MGGVSRQTWWLWVGAAVFFAGCAPEATLPAGALDPIRIGVVTSLSGALGADGPRWLDASRLAVLEINAAGGPLPGRPIELVVLDDETDVSIENPIALGRELLDRRVDGVVGAAASSITLGIAGVLSPEAVPQVSCCSTSDLVTEFNRSRSVDERYLFRTAPADELQAKVVAIAADDLVCTNLAIMHLDDSYGMPLGIAIEDAFRSGGGTVATRVSFTGGEPSYARQVSDVMASAPDCIALVAFPRSAGQILRDWAGAGGGDVTWIGTDGVRVPGFIDEVGDSSLLANFFGTSPITDARQPSYNAFFDRFEAAFGNQPISFASNQYDATALLGLAIARAGTTDGPAVRDALREVSTRDTTERFYRAGDLVAALEDIRNGNDIDYDGASGNTDFDELGNVVTPYEIWRYDPPAIDPCAAATVLEGDRGSFCRFRTINAEDIAP